MPELPEVETICRGLQNHILNKKIVSLQINKPKLIQNSLSYFRKIMVENQFTLLERRGKLLLFSLQKSSLTLLWHLKMTGQIIYQTRQKRIAGGHGYPDVKEILPNKYSHIIITFADKSQLFFNDQRQFGYLKLVTLTKKEQILKRFGIEPQQAHFTWQAWQKLLQRYPRSKIKGLLLNQQRIAGIGNIYADEICFMAQVYPGILVKDLSFKQIKKLFKACQQIIKVAILKGGTTFKNYVDSNGQKGNYADELKVYGRGGQPCLRCKKGFIQRIKLLGRGTCFCPICQNREQHSYFTSPI